MSDHDHDRQHKDTTATGRAAHRRRLNEAAAVADMPPGLLGVYRTADGGRGTPPGPEGTGADEGPEDRREH
ncbi:hypothetical protein ACF073_36045 [Streptomyces sp. NPDC015171]|uniref:hypothetical protein n=1 Tax=Streptomyces sp. NPDC015171 TaxID=3364945 RepID=UPI0036FF796C